MDLYANRYEVLENLGRGATGRVLLAKDVKTGRECALKILHSNIFETTSKNLSEFQKEFDVLTRLHHPSIAKVYDAGFVEMEIEGQKKREFFITTEFVKGQKLHLFCEKLNGEQIEELLVQVLRALNYLHEQQVLHLDIKPSNLLAYKDKNNQAQIKLIDFGFALISKGTSLGMEPLLGGTAPYIAPEMIRRERLDRRTDLYSLGCSFYQAITGRLPFKGTSDEEFFQKHLSEKPVPPSQLNPKLPAYFDAVILKLMNKTKEERYPSAQAVIEDINLLSKQCYAIETPETLQSYLPGLGILIGREKEFEQFEKIFKNRLQEQIFEHKPYLILTGEEGVGKTRFLKACKNYCQKNFIKTMDWNELMNQQTEIQIASPVVVFGDDVVIDSYALEFLDAFYEKEPLLAILTATQIATDRDQKNSIPLQNFSLEQTKAYLLKATGLEKLPAEIVKTFHQKTQGNPLYLTEYLKALFEKNLLKGPYGSWPLELLEDLGTELENKGATEFIKNQLIEKIKTLQLTKAHLDLLYTLALTGKPTLTDLEELTDALTLEEGLKDLVEHQILEIDPEHQYVFSNPLYKDIFLEQIDPEDKAKRCDDIANHYETQGMEADKVLYFRGRGKSKKAADCLLQLAQKKRQQQDDDRAKENLLELLKIKGLEKKIRQLAMLELGQIDIEMGNQDEAGKRLTKIIDEYKDCLPKHSPLILLEAYEHLGRCYKRIHKIDESTQCYAKGLRLANACKQYPWMEVVFKNRVAQNNLHVGKVKEAEKTLMDTWKVWKEKLNQEEKIAAIRNDLDEIYALKGEPQRAIPFLEEIAQVLSSESYLDSYPITLYKLGVAYRQSGQLDKAKKNLEHCLRELKQRRTPSWLYVVYNELGIIAVNRQDYQKALSSYQHAFQLARKQSFGSALYLIAYNIGNNYLKQGHLEEAIKYFHFVLRHIESGNLSKETHAGYYLYQTYLELASAHCREDNLKQADGMLKKAETLLQQKDFLEYHQQYYWQRKMELAKKSGKHELLKEASSKLDQMKKESWFNQHEYKIWQEEFLKVYA